MEFLKTIVAWAISPVILCLLLQLPGWLLWRMNRRKSGVALVGAGTLALFVGSLPIVSFHTNRAREAKHPPLADPAAIGPSRPVLVVVLGTGFNPDPELPANSQVSGNFLARLVEAVRIHRDHPESRLLVSVANTDATPQTRRAFLDAMASLLGLDPHRLELIVGAESTADEARIAKHFVRAGDQIVVVTSAGHMPRAIKTFANANLDSVPAPCSFLYPRAGSPGDKAWERWIPSGDAVGSTRHLLYESLASLVP